MMTIYQIHEYSGEYEDYRDYIVGTYLHKEKAVAKMEELQRMEEEKRAKNKKCSLCPITDIDFVADTFAVMSKSCVEYCSDAKITEDKFGYDCDNYFCYWEEATYEIKEVEVEE